MIDVDFSPRTPGRIPGRASLQPIGRPRRGIIAETQKTPRTSSGDDTVKIKEIRAAAIDITPKLKTQPRVPKVPTEGIGSVMARYPDIKRATWGNPWKRTA